MTHGWLLGYRAGGARNGSLKWGGEKERGEERSGSVWRVGEGWEYAHNVKNNKADGTISFCKGVHL